MKLLNTQPPIYHKLHEQFGVEWDKGIIIAYYPNVYCAKQIPDAKLIHEQLHLERQREMGVSLWWELYLSSASFRLEEEILAYKQEVQFLKDNFSRNERRFLLDKIYTDLSSYIYGSLVTYDEAKRLLA